MIFKKEFPSKGLNIQVLVVMQDIIVSSLLWNCVRLCYIC